MSQNSIGHWRKQIDHLDRRILELLGQRVDCVLKIADLKRENGHPVYDPLREGDVLNRLIANNRSSLPDEAVKRIFREIISACRAVQEPTTVSFLGPEDTFSHMATIKHFGRSVSFLPRGSISDVFREVEHGRADFGVVPAENSNKGTVGLTLDEWLGSDLKICGEVLIPVAHALMSREMQTANIRRVCSHQQALDQCRTWLTRNLPQAALVEVSSTASAAGQAAEEKGCAAVGAEILADRHGLNVLARNIQDQPVNLTRFFILGRRESQPTGQDKTSILFITAHKPGSLYLALEPLAKAEINMTRIESRPTRNRPWEYFFFVDFEGHQSEERVKTALDGLEANVATYKILGSYPAADKGDEALTTPNTELLANTVTRIAAAG